ncbi:MAG TPA: hypothetical protein H9792_04295 [Candidatus Limosilactobacillus excrementigallinarum]|nr:hypothetical protein [Candidatus Limosilactobacillus excrementigallinarum]
MTSPSDDGKKNPSPSTGGGASSSADAKKDDKPVDPAPSKDDANKPAENKNDNSSKPASDTGTSNQTAQPDTFDPKGSVKPTDAQIIPDIKAWLDAHKISYASNASKGDLLDLVNKA